MVERGSGEMVRLVMHSISLALTAPSAGQGKIQYVARWCVVMMEEAGADPWMMHQLVESGRTSGEIMHTTQDSHGHLLGEKVMVVLVVVMAAVVTAQATFDRQPAPTAAGQAPSARQVNAAAAADAAHRPTPSPSSSALTWSVQQPGPRLAVPFTFLRCPLVSEFVDGIPTETRSRIADD